MTGKHENKKGLRFPEVKSFEEYWNGGKYEFVSYVKPSEMDELLKHTDSFVTAQKVGVMTMGNEPEDNRTTSMLTINFGGDITKAETKLCNELVFTHYKPKTAKFVKVCKDVGKGALGFLAAVVVGGIGSAISGGSSNTSSAGDTSSAPADTETSSADSNVD